MMAIPRIAMRLRCWSIKLGFAERYTELVAPLASVVDAYDEVPRSLDLPLQSPLQPPFLDRSFIHTLIVSVVPVTMTFASVAVTNR